MTRKTICIVDDDQLLSEMLSDFLREKMPHIKIKKFATGEDCLKNLYEMPDVVILDYYLNSKEKDAANGIDILKEIKTKNKALPVIMLSSQKSYGVAAQSIGHGAIYYVIKGEQAFEEVFSLVEANI